MKPTILVLMRPNNFELLKELNALNKFDFVLYHPELEKRFLENSMEFESFYKYFNQYVMLKSTQAFSKIIPQWESLLKNENFQNEFTIENKQYFNLIKDDFHALFNDQAFTSILLIEAFKNLYYQRNLCLVLVWTDVIHDTKTITYIAKKYGIKVLQLAHGSLHTYKVGHFESEIYSDKIAVYGQHQKDFFQLQSGLGEKVVITGDPEKDKLFNGSITFDKEKICNELGIDQKSRIVFFGSTWTSPFSIGSFKNLQELTIKEFLKAFQKVQETEPSLQLAIKLHPTEYGKSSYYKSLAEEAGVKNYHIFESHLLELLFVCDIYTGFRSSIIIEALIFNKPVLLIDLYETSDEKFFEGLAIKWISKPEDIYENLKTYLYDEKAINEMKELIPKTVEYFNYKPDGQATKRIVDLICQMSEETLSEPVRERAIDIHPSGRNGENKILDLIDYQGKNILFINSLAYVDLQELEKRKGDSRLCIIEKKANETIETKETKETINSKTLYLNFDKNTIHQLGLQQNSFDYVVFKNSLETLYDPWSWIKDIRPYLKENGKVLIEIANIRNLGVFSSLVNGYFTYSDNGMISFDKIRFFTYSELAKHLINVGYTIIELHRVIDPSLKDSASINQIRNINYNFQGDNFLINNIPGDSLIEMHSRNILLIAQKNTDVRHSNFVSPLHLPKPADYFENPRIDLIEMIDKAPEMTLEIGCSSGSTCRAIKNRYPDCKTIGIDIDKESIKRASGVIDKAMVLDVEKVELSEAGIERESLDYIFYGDVLEHLENPWEIVRKHKEYLKKDGKIIASIPNIRYHSVLLSLLYGHWTYAPSGILDVTHLRFFTLREIKRLFRLAGLYIYDIKGNPDLKPEDLNFPGGHTHYSFSIQDLNLQNIPREEMPEFSIIQFRIKAGKDGKRLLSGF